MKVVGQIIKNSVLLGMGILLAAPLHASATKLSGLKPVSGGDFYFKSVQQKHELNNDKEKSLNEEIFNKTISDEMKSKYEAITKDREMKQNYRLNTLRDDQNYQQGARDLVDWTLKKLVQYHLENTVREKLEKSVKREAKESNSSEAKVASTAVSTISTIQKALQNTTVNFGPALKTRFRYDLPTGRFKMALTSKIVDADLDYRLLAIRLGGASRSGEKMNVAVRRDLGFLSASTGATYSVDSEVLNYGVNKSLVGPLSASVNQVKNLKDPQKDETVFQVNFGTSF